MFSLRCSNYALRGYPFIIYDYDRKKSDKKINHPCSNFKFSCRFRIFFAAKKKNTKNAFAGFVYVACLEFCCGELGRVTGKIEVKRFQEVLSLLISSVFHGPSFHGPRWDICLPAIKHAPIYIGETWRRWELLKQINLWQFSAFGKFVVSCDCSQWKLSMRFVSLNTRLGKT